MTEIYLHELMFVCAQGVKGAGNGAQVTLPETAELRRLLKANLLRALTTDNPY